MVTEAVAAGGGRCGCSRSWSASGRGASQTEPDEMRRGWKRTRRVAAGRGVAGEPEIAGRSRQAGGCRGCHGDGDDRRAEAQRGRHAGAVAACARTHSCVHVAAWTLTLGCCCFACLLEKAAVLVAHRTKTWCGRVEPRRRLRRSYCSRERAANAAVGRDGGAAGQVGQSDARTRALELVLDRRRGEARRPRSAGCAAGRCWSWRCCASLNTC